LRRGGDAEKSSSLRMPSRTPWVERQKNEVDKRLSLSKKRGGFMLDYKMGTRTGCRAGRTEKKL
jgi:hypothetical protein